MTYIEMLLLIQERAEKSLAADTRFIITDKHRYVRDIDGGESPWQQDKEPGAPERRQGRGGEYWVWKREEILPDPPAQFPEGT
jgi:hypothetical protein